MRLPQWKKLIDKAIKKRDGILVGAHRYKNAFVQKRKSPYSFERTGARLVARANVEIKRNEHISGTEQLYTNNVRQVRDERALHSRQSCLPSYPASISSRLNHSRHRITISPAIVTLQSLAIVLLEQESKYLPVAKSVLSSFASFPSQNRYL
ncbi:hypothetical protein XM73_c10765 [Vibrio vulnificus]|nr:hypothetical protein VVDAL79087_02884 [Vibrio vulnificus]OQK59219.1 hypothetical protein XM77_c10796 [Vibrio vulnificus]OUD80122.1 hypothetical protein XM73_c10765 [Vibrio vulnificus]